MGIAIGAPERVPPGPKVKVKHRKLPIPALTLAEGVIAGKHGKPMPAPPNGAPAKGKGGKPKKGKPKQGKPKRGG
jgi:hypothetical protein